jgi:hypothetical protein
VKFAPDAAKRSHNHGSHVFQVSAADYAVTLESEIPYVPGWGASVVKLGDKAPDGTGGLLDGKLPWPGYRWMKRDGVADKFWDGAAWKDLPRGFRLADSNNFCVGFYKSGSAYTCQYGGAWPEAFADWDPEAADKAAKIASWKRNIDETWSGKIDLKSRDCRSAAPSCCRYPLNTRVQFTRKAAFGAGMLIVADGNIRSNDSLFFLDEARIAVAAHEFGHHIGNPDEYAGAVIDTSLNDDGAVNGIDANSIMGQNLTTVKARHLRTVARVFGEALKAEHGRTFTLDPVVHEG